jgi:uncharacterized membrane protein
MPLRVAAVCCHVVLATALAASVLAAAVTPLRTVAAVALTLPLLLTVRGLVLGRRTTEQRLAVLLVLYVGGAAVEVVAHSGTAPLASIALLAAVLELGLTLVLIRRSPRRASVARE